MTTITVKHFDIFNQRRYSDPWVAIVDDHCRPDFSRRVGLYTGGHRTGEAGDLMLLDPEDGAVYAWGQKDYRGGNTERGWALYRDGKLEPLTYAEAVVYAAAKAVEA